MKKQLIHCYFLLLFSVFGINSWGQSFTFSPDTLIAGVPDTVYLTGTGMWFAGATGTYIRPQGGGPQIKDSTYNGSGAGPYSIYYLPANTSPGNYDMYHYGWGYPTTLASNTMTVLPPAGNAGFIFGSMISDNNGNCINDAGDTPMANQVLTITPGPFYTTTDANGDFAAIVAPGNYTVTASAIPSHNFSCPAVPTFTANVPNPGDTVTGLDYFRDTLSYTDVGVTGVPPFAIRPGFTNNYYLYVRNNSPRTLNNLTGYLVFDTDIIPQMATPAASSVSGDTLFWSIPSLASTAQFSVVIQCSVSVATVLDDTVSWTAGVLPYPGDANASNNTQLDYQVVTGSYDPNDKQVWNEFGENADGFVEINETELDYLIRFQNTGTDTAFNIVVRDTMDLGLDLSTFRVTATSHPMTHSITGNGKVAFNFDNILLPDSNVNEEGSHGFVRYTVNRFAGQPTGTSIENTAHIYFDFNAPIVTNTVQTVVCPEMTADFAYFANAQTVDFSNNAIGAYDDVVWTFGDGDSSTTTNPTHVYPAAGTYPVCMALSSACGQGDTICDTISVTFVGLEASLLNTLEVYPNPNKGIFAVELDLGQGLDKAIEVEVYDVQGKLLQRHTEELFQSHFRRDFDLRSLPSGVYQLKVKLGDAQVFRKVVLEN